MKVQVIATGSSGNAVLYDSVLVDCGVSYKMLTPYLKQIKLILLTHIHSDHLNIRTIKKICKEYPLIRFASCDWLTHELLKADIKNLDTLEIGKTYDYGIALISPVYLYHDVKNCGYRIFINNKKIFHATDTYTLEGITAKNYDIYAIECNYDEEIIDYILENSNDYEHGYRSKLTHLSKQQAHEFVYNNASHDFEFIKLHQSSKYSGVIHENNS